MKGLNLNIVSPEKELFRGDVESITLPGTLGSFTILPQHAPIVSSLTAGMLTFVAGGKEQTLQIRGGFVEMNNNQVSVCVEN